MKQFAAIIIMLMTAGMCRAQSDSAKTVADSIISGAPAFRSRWEVGVRTSGLTDFPGTVTVGWIPGLKWLLNLDLGGNYTRYPYGNGWDIRSGIGASLGIKRRVMAGRFVDFYLGLGPCLEYDYEYRSSSVYPDGWMKVWTRRYDLSLSLQAGLRRVLKVWDRHLAIELGCSPVSLGAVFTKVSHATYDHNSMLIDEQMDWKPNEYSARGTLTAQSYIGIAYRF